LCLPLYEFICPQGHRIEELRSMKESAAACVCFKCGYEARRVISMPHVSVKKAVIIRRDKRKLVDKVVDKHLPPNSDGTPYKFTETGEKNRQKEAARHIEKSLLSKRPDNPMGLSVTVHET
jgi:putative FmdB family regulatory protein